MTDIKEKTRTIRLSENRIGKLYNDVTSIITDYRIKVFKEHPDGKALEAMLYKMEMEVGAAAVKSVKQKVKP